jgi:hypothetical protein
MHASIATHRIFWPSRMMSRKMAVSRSGIHEWLVSAPSQRRKEDARLIQGHFELGDRTYGLARPVHNGRELRA